MHLPHLDPILLQWCDLVSDVVTTLASSGACVLAKGKVSSRGGELSLAIEDLKQL